MRPDIAMGYHRRSHYHRLLVRLTAIADPSLVKDAPSLTRAVLTQDSYDRTWLRVRHLPVLRHRCHLVLLTPHLLLLPLPHLGRPHRRPFLLPPFSSVPAATPRTTGRRHPRRGQDGRSAQCLLGPHRQHLAIHEALLQLLVRVCRPGSGPVVWMGRHLRHRRPDCGFRQGRVGGGHRALAHHRWRLYAVCHIRNGE